MSQEDIYTCEEIPRQGELTTVSERLIETERGGWNSERYLRRPRN